MRRITFVLSLILAFMIPWEGVIRTASLGNGTKITGFVVAAMWFATIIVTRQVRKPVPFHLALYLFVLWNALSVFWSSDPGDTVGHVITWVQLLVMALIWWDLYTTEASILAGLQAFVLGAYVAVGSAIANYFSGYQFYNHYERYSAGETNPDGFGFIMALGIPLAWYLSMPRHRNQFENVLRVINYVYIPTALLGIALSGTRTALIASIPGMIFGLATMTRIRLSTRIVTVLFLALVIYIMVPQLQHQRSFQRLGTTATELTEGDLNNRTNNWREGFAAFADHPILGVGSSMYPSVNRWGKAAHNSYLSILVEVGLIGFFLFAYMLMNAAYQGWKQPKWQRRFWMTTLFVWAIGASTLTWGHRKPTWLILNLVVASGAVVSRQEETEEAADDGAVRWLPPSTLAHGHEAG
jgi:O-antigen ligase